MKWIEALKVWNIAPGQNKNLWKIPKKNTPENAEVKEMMGGKKAKEAQARAEMEEELRVVPPRKKKRVIKISDEPEVDLTKEYEEGVLSRAKTTAQKAKLKAFLSKVVAKKRAKMSEKEISIPRLYSHKDSRITDALQSILIQGWDTHEYKEGMAHPTDEIITYIKRHLYSNRYEKMPEVYNFLSDVLDYLKKVSVESTWAGQDETIVRVKDWNKIFEDKPEAKPEVKKKTKAEMIAQAQEKLRAQDAEKEKLRQEALARIKAKGEERKAEEAKEKQERDEEIESYRKYMVDVPIVGVEKTIEKYKLKKGTKYEKKNPVSYKQAVEILTSAGYIKRPYDIRNYLGEEISEKRYVHWAGGKTLNINRESTIDKWVREDKGK